MKRYLKGWIKFCKKFFKKHKSLVTRFGITGIIGFFIAAGLIVIWIASFQLPSLNNFEQRQVAQSTKIYDRTGEVLLYDIHGEFKRTIVPFEEISEYAKLATVAIEDSNFYNHGGVEPKAILRAILVNLKNGDLLGGQGGSTITQQVIKNALLTSDKKVSRKVKEWFLAPRLEKILTKDEVLEVYLNEIPYGGNVYGIQEASQRFFSKDASKLTLGESAYLAALPQAPSRYSPYGNNPHLLEARKNFVLREMRDNNFITASEYEEGITEEVTFQKQEVFGIKAPHFVIWIREQLEELYGEEAVLEGGLKVITTLDWELQEKAEEIVKRYAFKNKEQFDAENAAVVATDPKTGQILSMVGSRDYFDSEIDGNFNVILADRQPGSSIKPIIYAEAFRKGYRPETVVFDVLTEFSAACATGGSCYNPGNYDGKFRGAVSLRDALAQSLNIPAVKTFYLAGRTSALQLAKNMGLTSLTNIKQYGLTLVLGGGEVRPFDMATAYGVFANDGVKHAPAGILRIEDQHGTMLDEYEEDTERVLDENVARQVSDILSDNAARAPLVGSNSPMYFGGIDVAAKTGTTNDYRDAWIIGYTPETVLVAWAGNNDNRVMKQVTGFRVSTMWREIMDEILKLYPSSSFTPPKQLSSDVKPIIRGVWKNETRATIDTRTNTLATDDTPDEFKEEIIARAGGVPHSILHSVNTADPLGAVPTNPGSDPQYKLWEEGVASWSTTLGFTAGTEIIRNVGSTQLNIVSPEDGKNYFADGILVVVVTTSNGVELKYGDVIINNEKIGEINTATGAYDFIPSEVPQVSTQNILRIVAEDVNGNKLEETIRFGVQ